MREIRMFGLMSGVGKRGGPSGSVLAPNLDSTDPPGLSDFAASEKTIEVFNEQGEAQQLRCG